jgi:hypothetical protein
MNHPPLISSDSSIRILFGSSPDFFDFEWLFHPWESTGKDGYCPLSTNERNLGTASETG